MPRSGRCAGCSGLAASSSGQTASIRLTGGGRIGATSSCRSIHALWRGGSHGLGLSRPQQMYERTDLPSPREPASKVSLLAYNVIQSSPPAQSARLDKPGTAEVLSDR